jgi:hippurate hydrolase
LEIEISKGSKTLNNSDIEAENVRRAGLKFFGEENIVDGVLPIYASEDFAYYTEKIPGAFFFLSSKKKPTDEIMLHSSKFDFPDELIEIGSKFWLEIARDRLEF